MYCNLKALIILKMPIAQINEGSLILMSNGWVLTSELCLASYPSTKLKWILGTEHIFSFQ